MFLARPDQTDQNRHLYEDDVETLGYVMNLTHAWAWRPELVDGLFALIRSAAAAAGLSAAERAVLVVATARSVGDSYCALSWGVRLVEAAGIDAAVGVLEGRLNELTERERALARWAVRVTRHASSTSAEEVEELRKVGFDEAQILALTTFVACRSAFATVNDALGARPDHQLVEAAPRRLVEAVDFGRSPGSREE